ncbi:MAG: flavodoxin family protein [Methanomicrobiales archaeon]|nr:flavodoxin family protein [Methanomicrobiales archaeon]
MKAFLLDGSRAGDTVSTQARELIESELRAKGWEVSSLTLRDMEMAPCLGCFKCWTHTPGVCVTDDAGTAVVKGLIASDLAVFLTPVTFGGYSSVLKKALDRTIPLLLPFFRKVGGEVRHAHRYDSQPRIMALGVLPRPDPDTEQLFRTLVSRNAMNFGAPERASGVITRDMDSGRMRGEVHALIVRAGVGP